MKRNELFWLIRLVLDIRILGFSMGYRYWRMRRRAAKDPEMIRLWAESAEKAADEIDDPKFRWCCRNWAIQLRKCYDENKRADLERLA